MIERRFLVAPVPALLLAACSATGGQPGVGVAPAPVGPPASAFTATGPLLGLDARRLTQMFGQPRLDIREQAARKLQFSNGRCVLDAYLYVPVRGKEAVVTHVDARNPVGIDVDPAGCATALQAK